MISALQLANFKNHAEGLYTFSPKLSCITGLNGSGKTNLLDAVYLLALTKSRFQKSDQDLIAHGQTYYRLEGRFGHEGPPHKVSLAYQMAERKILKQDGLEVERLADHIGKIPVVFVNPDDTPLVKGPAEERRAFFDNLLSQSSAPYLQALLKQTRLLRQRNVLLAQMQERRATDTTLLDSYDEPLLEAMAQLRDARQAAVAEFAPPFEFYYARLSQGREQPQIVYQSQTLDEDFTRLYYLSRPRDMAAARTMLGTHRDDFELLMSGQPVRKVGSQGQQKTFLLAMKLAMADYLEARTGRRAILLLDDIMERLDQTRIAGLLALIASGRLGQAILTEATGARMMAEVKKAGLETDATLIELGLPA